MVNFDDLIPQEKKLPSRGRTMLEQGLSGATLNFADEIYSRLGALGAYGYQASTDMPTQSQNPVVGGVNLGAVGRGINSLQELTDLATAETNKRLNEQLLERPALSIGSNIAGALLTGGAGVGTKAGKTIANSLRSGKLGARIGKAGVLGAATGSASGFGSGEGGFEDRLASAGTGALAGGVAGGVIPVVGAAAGRVAKQFQKIPKAATSDEIKSLASAAYKKADESGGVLKGWFTNRFLDDIADIQPPSIAGKRVPTDPKLDEALNYVNSFKNTRLTLQDAQNLDEYLGEAIDGFTDSFGRVNKSGSKLLEVQSRFRNAIENADDALIEGGKEGFEALKEGRALWSAQLKLRDIERIIQRAELTQNPSTAIQTGFRNLLTNAKKSKGYTKEELAAIEKAAKTGIVADILKTGGSRLVPIIAGASGGGVFGTAVAGAGAAASRGLATRNAIVNAENVARAVSNRAVPKAAVRYTETPKTSKKQIGAPEVELGKIRLYRGLEQPFDKNYNSSLSDAPQGYSTWTDNPDLAREYAGKNGFVYYTDLPKNKLGKELVDQDGERALFVDNEKPAGLRGIKGKEFLLYTEHDDYRAQNIKEFLDNSGKSLPQAVSNGGLPAVLSSPRSGQLAAPAGAVVGGQSPTRIEVNPNQPNPYAPDLDFNDLIPQQPMQQQQPLAPQSSASPLMERIKQAESSGNPNAQNPLSTASGLYQFTDDTWRSVVDKFGRRSGIRYSDKNNPQAQEQMVTALLQDNARILQNKGIEPSDANLYFAHFMGAPAASKAISMLGKNAIAARSFPDAAKANPTVFFDGQRPRTVDEVYQIITSKVV